MRAVGSQGETRDIARALLAHVTYQRLLGAVGAPAAEVAPVAPPRAPERPVARTVTSAPVPPAKDAGPETLADVRADLGDCRRCQLAGGRTNLVYGVGDP